MQNKNYPNLKEFIIKSFEILNPGSDYIDSWYIDYLCEILSEATKGNQKKIIINLPPRFLKSHIITTAFTAWLLGINPTKRIISASYNQALSNKLSVDTRLLIESEWYKEMFPDTVIYKKQNEKKKFMTTANGFRFATSSGGTIIGEGGDFLIMDDPHHPAQIRSKHQREKLFDWFDKSFLTRLNNQNSGVVIVVMQRLHANDLTGYLLAKPNSQWNVYSIPLIEESTRLYKIGKFEYLRKKGELLNPGLINYSRLKDLKEELGDIVFQTQYQQKPIANVGQIIKPDKLSYYETLPDKFEMILQSWDTAAVVSEKADYSACITFGIHANHVYIIDIYREKLEYPQLKQIIVEKYEFYKPITVLVENKMTGLAVISEVTQEYLIPIVAREPVNDKLTRFLSISGLFESKRVLIPKNHPMLVDFINELVSFPDTNHDDMVDSLSQGLFYIKSITTLLRKFRE